jgi:hypothetical protein
MSDEIHGDEGPRDTVGFIGPMYCPTNEYKLAVNGRRVPFVTCRKMGDGTMHFVLDGRMVFECAPLGYEDAVAVMLAHAIAIGMGYACHPSGEDEPVRANPFPRVARIGEPEPALRIVPEPEEPSR